MGKLSFTSASFRTQTTLVAIFVAAKENIISPTGRLLRDVFEFDYDEIARMIGKSESTTRQFLHRARMRVRRTGPPRDVEEFYVGMCWHAIEARDPAFLMDMLQITAAQAQPAATAVARPRSARSFQRLVHVNGRYAIALVLDGVVLCIVPVGTQTSAMAESM
jgi:hypothetical protein